MLFTAKKISCTVAISFWKVLMPGVTSVIILSSQIALQMIIMSHLIMESSQMLCHLVLFHR